MSQKILKKGLILKFHVFSDAGYNFLPSEISAAFALEQLKKLGNNIKIRRRNFKILTKFFLKYSKYFKLPMENKGVITPWLAYPLVVKKNKRFNRSDLQIFLEKNKIQTRVIFTGNIIKQPIMKNRTFKANKLCNKVANDVMKNGILIGCHHGMSYADLKYMMTQFEKFLK